MRTVFGACIALVVGVGAVLADPVGKYDVSGTNASDGSKYSGEVTVEKTGDTYKVTWNIGGKRYDGTGIGFDDFLAVSYKAGNETGLALYGEQDENWKGVWTYAGSRKLGAEEWTKK